MADFRKVIVGDALIAAKYFPVAEKMLSLLKRTGQKKKAYKDKKITIIASIIGGVAKAIFIAPAMYFLQGRYSMFNKNKYKILRTNILTGDELFLTEEIDLSIFFPTSGLDLPSFYLLLRSPITYNNQTIEVIRAGEEKNFVNFMADGYRRSIYYNVPLGVTSYSIGVSFSNGVVTKTKTVPSQNGTDGKPNLNLTILSLSAAINVDFPESSPLVSSGFSGLVFNAPVLSLSGIATNGVNYNIYSDPIPDETWPPKNINGSWDRGATFKVSEFVDKKVFDWTLGNQPLNPQTKYYPIGEHFTVDTQSETILKTNEFGYEKRIGKVVLWEKMLSEEDAAAEGLRIGQFKKINTGITLPSSPFSLADVVASRPSCADSQLVSAHNNHKCYFNFSEYSVGATPYRFYLTLVDHKVMEYLDTSHAFIATVERDSPNAISGGLVYLPHRRASEDGISLHYFCGYVHDHTGRYGGVWEFCYGYEVDDGIKIEPRFNVFLCDEDGPTSEGKGMQSLHSFYQTRELYGFYSKPNPYPVLSYSETYEIFPNTNFPDYPREDDNVCYIYKGKIVIIIECNGDSPTRTQLPTDVWTIDIETGEARSIWGKFEEGRIIRQISTSHEGRFIYLFDELISTSADGFAYVIDLEDESMSVFFDEELNGQDFDYTYPYNRVSFTRPLHAPKLK